MKRTAVFVVATLLGTFMIAAWVVMSDRALQVAKTESREISRLDLTICFETGLEVKSAASRFGATIKPIDQGCKVENIGDGEYEVESSFLVKNGSTPIHYTVRIGGGVVHEEEYLQGASWYAIKLHGFNRDFVPLMDFGLSRVPRPI